MQEQKQWATRMFLQLLSKTQICWKKLNAFAPSPEKNKHEICWYVSDNHINCWVGSAFLKHLRELHTELTGKARKKHKTNSMTIMMSYLHNYCYKLG